MRVPVAGCTHSLWIALVVMLPLAPLVQAQQAPCSGLGVAQEQYYNGQFEATIEIATRCLEQGTPSEMQRRKSYRLIGLSYIGQDLRDSAREVVEQLITLAPNFEADPATDPPQFVQLVEEMKASRTSPTPQPTPSTVPDVGAQPLYATVTLSAGFAPDPYTTEVVAGGNDQNPISGSGCVGYLNAARPDIDINYSAGSYPLSIAVDSETDTALLINLPDGSWVCDDDTGGNGNPIVHLPNPQSGNYNVWVATYRANSQTEATIYLTEQAPANGNGNTNGGTTSGVQPDIGAQPLYGTANLGAGFSPDPHVTSIDAGGSDQNPINGSGCAGYINAERPDLDLNYSAGSYKLFIYAQSQSDTTLLVNLPDGSWVCSDDAMGRNPVIALDNPQSGNYNIWVGTYAAGSPQNATILISERDPR